jgi:hypothetical protein
MTDLRKKDYRTPTLTVYGSIREITNALGSTTANMDTQTGSTMTA